MAKRDELRSDLNTRSTRKRRRARGDACLSDRQPDHGIHLRRTARSDWLEVVSSDSVAGYFWTRLLGMEPSRFIRSIPETEGCPDSVFPLDPPTT